ncbi:putative popld domain-containing protein [Erysiphe necator]|uniref:Putative popld domain-containing protein n=1 Tax=Uncinula necator TaxID=52586 RepID=A0A0B1PCY1_UNCNE|nr:putative popld domain-containing protein [Erysiphe necator]
MGSPHTNSGLKRPREASSTKLPQGKKNNIVKKYEKKIDARSIATQSSEAALKNGQLDVEAFLRSREFEIKALQDGMQRAKKNLSKKALQKVPREMRRRTASHNVKRLPRKLQKRAAKDMKFENTPTITANKRKPRTSRARLRTETAKKLSLLSSKKISSSENSDEKCKNISTRLPRPKIRKNQLNQAPILKPRYRKRQINKNWLPTHIWHAKRAKMTNPNNPLWRFAIPITPTEKSYRPTHRAGGLRGAIAWDMSYISTLCLEGSESGLENFLKKIGVTEKWLWEEKGLKWRSGKRSWNGWLSKIVNDKSIFICPSIILWCPLISDNSEERATATTTTKVTATAPTSTNKRSPKKSMRRVLLRIHPSAFLETWTELLRLSKLQRPMIHVQDLRFEIGGIDITGPGSTETLLGILHPYSHMEANIEEHAQTFLSLAGLTNPATLPNGAVLSFSIMDPRLRYPPRTIKFPGTSDEENLNLLQRLSEWPVDDSSGSDSIFDQAIRFKATHLPSQKAINRRKGLAPPGSFPDLTINDPPIPIVLLASRNNKSSSFQGTWTILAPWRCILPLWYGLVHYPLSTGGNPRFGGLQELQQIQFEYGSVYFPINYLATASGYSWEVQERLKNKSEWDKRPKGKKIEWDSLDLGNGRIGEVGRGWSCDFEYLLKPTKFIGEDKNLNDKNKDEAKADQAPLLDLIRCNDFRKLLSNKSTGRPSPNTVAVVHIRLVGRGVARYAARIYRLPSPKLTTNSSDSPNTNFSKTLRQEWLSILSTENKKSCGSSKKAAGPKYAKTHAGRIPLNTPLPKRVRLLAQSLLQQPPLPYPNDNEQKINRENGLGNGHPLVPNTEDLIGFVTTGEYCLTDGKGAAIGNILVSKILDRFRTSDLPLEKCDDGQHNSKCDSSNSFVISKEAKLCIVRNSGESIGRLAFWEPI